MTIFRVQKETNYSVVDNVPINDARLSWGARGMLIYLLSKPDGWTVRTADLIRQSPSGRDATQGLINELKAAGYLVRIPIHRVNGTIDYETHIHERPVNGFSVDGSAVDGKPVDVVMPESVSTEKTAATAARPKPEKKGDILDGMIFYGKQAAGKPDIGFLNEHLRPMAEAFCQAAGEGYYPAKSDQSLWRKAFGEYYERGFTADQIGEATRLHREGGLSLKGPQSIEYKIRELVAGPAEPEYRQRNLTLERLAAEKENGRV